MSTLLISYDLQAPGKDYEKLWDYLRTYGNWARPLESVWLIKTDKTPEEVRNLIQNSYIDRNDKIFVVDVTGKSAAWDNLVAEVSTWIKNNL